MVGFPIKIKKKGKKFEMPKLIQIVERQDNQEERISKLERWAEDKGYDPKDY